MNFRVCRICNGKTGKFDALNNGLFAHLDHRAEQHRIVAKVDELLKTCGHIKEKIRHANQIQTHLAAALVEKTLA